MLDPESVKETAKAVQEVAKTGNNAITSASQIGGFIARYISGPIEQGMGIYEDKLKYARWENQVRLQIKAEAFMKEIGLSHPTRPLPLKLAIPLFQAASLEDEESLQDLWARLLVNAVNADSTVELQRVHIDILERITSQEAQIIRAVYSATSGDGQTNGVWTRSLPESAEPAMILSQAGAEDTLAPEVTLALANLERLGCLEADRSFWGGSLFSKVFPTYLGRSFFEACTLKR